MIVNLLGTRCGKSSGRHPVAEVMCGGLHLGWQGRVLRKDLEHFQAGANHGRSQSVGKQVGACLLPQNVHDSLLACGVATGGAAQCLAKCGIDDVDFAHHIPVLVSAAPRCAKEAGGVALVHEDLGIVHFRKTNNLPENKK